MKYVVWVLVLLLVILHQDNWNWEKDTLVLGFIPIGLAWHAGISIAASTVWFLATVFAWPDELKYAEDQPQDPEVSA
jgi:hypothetical protein